MSTRTDAASPGPGHVWVWDLYPLSAHAWPNQQTKAAPPGDAVMLTAEVWAGSIGNIFTGAERHEYRTVERRGYRPTEADLEILRQAFVGADPRNPSWPNVESELIGAGRTKAELVELNAPTLVKLLGKAIADAAGATATDDTPPDAARVTSVAAMLKPETRAVLRCVYQWTSEGFPTDDGQHTGTCGAPMDYMVQAMMPHESGLVKSIDGPLRDLNGLDLIRRGTASMLHLARGRAIRSDGKHVGFTHEQVDRLDTAGNPIRVHECEARIDEQTPISTRFMAGTETKHGIKLTRLGLEVALTLQAGEHTEAGKPAGRGGAPAGDDVDEKKLAALPDSLKCAYLQHRAALKYLQASGNAKPTWEEKHTEAVRQSDNDGAVHPVRDSWRRYVNQAMVRLGERSPSRAGRQPGRSIVKSDEL